MYNTIRLSSSGGSAWSVQLYLNCPYQFKLRYLDKLSERLIPQNLWFGSLIHEAILIERIFNHQTDEVITRNLNNKVFQMIEQPMKPNKTVYEVKTPPDELTSLSKKMLDALASEHIDVQEVESYYECHLTHPLTGEIDDHVIVNGRIDLVERVGIKESYVDNLLTMERIRAHDQQVAITDLKTSSTKLASLAGHLFQLTFYAYLYYLKHYQLPDYVSILNVTKTKDPSVQRLWHKPCIEEIVALYQQVKAVSQQIREGVFVKNFSSCINKYRAVCPYLSICHPEMYEIPEIQLNNILTVEDTHE